MLCLQVHVSIATVQFQSYLKIFISSLSELLNAELLPKTQFNLPILFGYFMLDGF